MHLNLHKRRLSCCEIGTDISAVIPFACRLRRHFAAGETENGSLLSADLNLHKRRLLFDKVGM